MFKPRAVELKRPKQGAKRAMRRALSLSGVPQSGQVEHASRKVSTCCWRRCRWRVLRRCLDSARVNPRCSMRWWFLLRVMTSVTVSSSPSSLHMTSCSLTRIEGLLRVRVAGKGNGPFYRTFAISPSISLLSKGRAEWLSRSVAPPSPIGSFDPVSHPGPYLLSLSASCAIASQRQA